MKAYDDADYKLHMQFTNHRFRCGYHYFVKLIQICKFCSILRQFFWAELRANVTRTVREKKCYRKSRFACIRI